MKRFVTVNNESSGYVQKSSPSCDLEAPTAGPPIITAFARDCNGIFYSQEFKLEGKNLTLELGHTIHRQHGIIGRSTCAMNAAFQCTQHQEPNPFPIDIDKIWHAGRVIKLSWIVKNRVVDRTKSACAQATDQASKYLSQLPLILHHETGPLSRVSERLANTNSSASKDYEMRELRITIVERLAPITQADLANAEQLRKSVMEILECHHWLYDIAKIFHHDINAQNLMLRPDSEQSYHGILNDFDLALDFHVARNRTGTRPFMALDLLEPNMPPHNQIYCHDLESFYWVLLWIACRYPPSEFEGAQKPFEDWLTLDQENLYIKKNVHLMNARRLNLTETFSPLEEALAAIHMMFKSGHNASSNHRFLLAMGLDVAEPNFDDETMGGRVTYDNFHSYLQITSS